MAAFPADNRVRPGGLNTAGTTVAIPGRGQPWGIFVQTDGNRRFNPSNITILQLPFGWQAGQHFGAGGARLRLISLEFKSVIHGQGILARFNSSTDSTMDRGGNVMWWFRALRTAPTAHRHSLMLTYAEVC